MYAADLDGDGDTDVLSASSHDSKIAWYENDGSENFNSRTISIAALQAHDVYAADVDGDGDLDVLSASTSDDKIAWYENKRTIFGSNPDVTDAPDPLPLPPPPLPIGHTLYFGAATVGERSLHPLPNGRGSEELSPPVRSGSQSAPPVTDSILPYLKIASMKFDESYVALFETTFLEWTR